MGYAAIVLAILGVAIGLVFRLRFLLGAVTLLLVISLAFAFSRDYGVSGTILAIIVSQVILQGSYFLGLVSRMIFSVVQRKPVSFSKPETEHLRDG